MARRRFEPRERARLLADFVRLRAEGVAMSRIAENFGVSSMTLYRWERELEQRQLPEPVKPALYEGSDDDSLPTLSALSTRSSGRDQLNVHSEADWDVLKKENVWLHGLVKKLLFENERLKAEISGKL